VDVVGVPSFDSVLNSLAKAQSRLKNACATSHDQVDWNVLLSRTVVDVYAACRKERNEVIEEEEKKRTLI